MAAFADLGRRHGISRRTLERTRAKLAQLGVIERITWMHRRFGGQSGWVLSSRMTTTLRQLADLWEVWRTDPRADRTEKETMLAELLRPAARDSCDPDSR
jgi:DNA-binding HxlR family transcriptional regulator